MAVKLTRSFAHRNLARNPAILFPCSETTAGRAKCQRMLTDIRSAENVENNSLIAIN
jgi:hypothetical protein